MPLKIIRDSHSEIVGRGPLLLSVPPSSGQSRDVYVGEIVEQAALLSKAHAIIAKEAKGNLDPKDLAEALSEFDEASLQFLQELDLKCVLVISGKNDPGFELQTLQGGPNTDEILLMVRARFGADFNLKITQSQKAAPGVPPGDVQTIWIGIGSDANGFQKDSVISRLADLVTMIEGVLGGSKSNEGGGDVLD